MIRTRGCYSVSEKALQQNSRIFVAGHNGLVGSAIIRRLDKSGFEQVIVRPRAELDLLDRSSVVDFFSDHKPEYVFLAAAKVGGIQANNEYPASFIHDNLAIQLNVIDAAYRSGTKKLLFLGSSCIYPKLAPQPIKEEYLLTGLLEPTNDAYAIAKIAGIKMCQAYRKQYGFNAISLMPTNLYGPGDNFDLENSHVLPALIRKFHEAKESNSDHVSVWGTGRPKREFLYVDDLADACFFLMENYDSGEIINVGMGEDISIHKLSQFIAGIVGFNGEIVFDTSKPDGTPRKLLDIEKIKKLGWSPNLSLADGIAKTYRWYVQNL